MLAAISSSLNQRRRAASLLLLATIEAGFNSYSLNSNSVGQDAGVSSTLTLRLSSKALSPAARVLSFSLRRPSPRFLRLSKIEKGRPWYVRRWTIGNRPCFPSSTYHFLLRYFYHGPFFSDCEASFPQMSTTASARTVNEKRDTHVKLYRVKRETLVE